MIDCAAIDVCALANTSLTPSRWHLLCNAQTELTLVVPFLVEGILKNNGGNYSKAADWQPHVVADGPLITGQNPASSAAARTLLEMLARPSLAR